MLIKSALVTQWSGSIGGMVGSHNRGGLYLRARTIPVNTNTTRQQNARAALRAAVTRWTEVLSAGQRTGWEDYAAATPVINALGDSKTLTGQQMYIRSEQVGQMLTIELGTTRTPFASAPSLNNLGDFTPATFAHQAGATADLGFDNADTWANEDLSFLIYQRGTQAQNASVNFFAGPWQLMEVVEGDSVTPPTSPEGVAGPVDWDIGQRAYARVRVLRTDGRLSTPQIMSALRAA